MMLLTPTSCTIILCCLVCAGLYTGIYHTPDMEKEQVCFFPQDVYLEPISMLLEFSHHRLTENTFQSDTICMG